MPNPPKVMNDCSVASVQSVSIAAPAYNEQEVIKDVVETWLDYLRTNPQLKDFEIVICNDGSSDATGLILNEISILSEKVRVVKHEKNQGAAAALTSAIENTRKEWVFLLDADGQFPVHNFELLSQAVIKDNVRCVIGIRQKKDNLYSRFGSWASGLVCNYIYGVKLKDFNSACKLIDGDLIRSLNLESKGMNYSTEITAKLLEYNTHVIEVPIDHKPRLAGSSKMKLVQGSIHRIVFIIYLAYRKLLLSKNIIQVRSSVLNNIS